LLDWISSDKRSSGSKSFYHVYISQTSKVHSFGPSIGRYLFLPMLPKSASQLPLPRPSSEVIPFFRQLLCSLHSLHSIGIWHEDLKPANILMTSEGKPVLADFGLTTFSPGFMKMNGGGGTLDYMSPEKIEVSLVIPLRPSITGDLSDSPI
jgi:serine/threonine protein kinase